ncbi:MAG: hypothetical protein ACLR0N_01120 [Bilophila wadsworthia]
MAACPKGHEVTVYEADERMGGKLEQVIPAPAFRMRFWKRN